MVRVMRQYPIPLYFGLRNLLYAKAPMASRSVILRLPADVGLVGLCVGTHALLAELVRRQKTAAHSPCRGLYDSEIRVHLHREDTRPRCNHVDRPCPRTEVHLGRLQARRSADSETQTARSATVGSSPSAFGRVHIYLFRFAT